MRFALKQAFLGIFFLLVACSPKLHTTEVQYLDYQISKNAPVDSAMVRFLEPYKNKMQLQMDQVIGVSVSGLFKKQPESTMGNFMVDAMKIQAEQLFQEKVDAAFVNYFGVRSNFQKGNITIGSVYELMPFDNLVVLQVMSGKVLKQLVDVAAMEGGWPVAGIQMQIKDKKAINIKVNGKALELEASYTVANSDYVANGGSGCSFLKVIPQKNRGVLLRDALITVITERTTKGKTIDAIIENRVSLANE